MDMTLRKPKPDTKHNLCLNVKGTSCFWCTAIRFVCEPLPDTSAMSRRAHVTHSFLDMYTRERVSMAVNFISSMKKVHWKVVSISPLSLSVSWRAQCVTAVQAGDCQGLMRVWRLVLKVHRRAGNIHKVIEVWVVFWLRGDVVWRFFSAFESPHGYNMWNTFLVSPTAMLLKTVGFFSIWNYFLVISSKINSLCGVTSLSNTRICG